MGPTSMKKSAADCSRDTAAYDLVDEESDREIRPSLNVKATQVKENLVARFEKFSTWKSLLRAICVLKRVCKLRHKRDTVAVHTVEEFNQAEQFVIRTTQRAAFEEEISSLQCDKKLRSNSGIIQLTPFLGSCQKVDN